MDAALKAMADPTRRAILSLILARERTAGEIASHFDVSRPAISQHLRVLLEAGLADVRPEGTRRLYRANASAIAVLRQELDAFWRTSLDRLKAAVEAEVRSSRPDGIGGDDG
ncbi:MAG: metalloregulator ArsR/SmtB family transcription factor [Azospirillaceae bacterium]